MKHPTSHRVPLALGALALLASAPARAQAPMPSPRTATAATVPVMLQGAVPEGEATAEEIPLGLSDAIARGLRQNLGVLESNQSVRLARATRNERRADLLPSLTGHVAETRQKINLAAFGFTGLPGTQDFPTIVGPFNVFDARLGVSQTVFDLHALERARAEGHNLRAAQFAAENTRDLVVLVIGNLYLRVGAAQSALDAAREQRTAAEALFRLAGDRKEAGLVAGIEVLRAQVQLQQRKERELQAANQLEKAKLDLARAIGLPLGQRFAITDPLTFAPPPPMTEAEATKRAYEARADWKEAQARLRAAEASRRAARGELLPTLNVGADYGQIGNSPSSAEGTYTLSAAVRVPLFEGGRGQARVAEADAALEQRRAEARELEARIHYEVQAAFLDLASAAARVETARLAVELATQQLEQARDRFANGVAGNIDVVQAQDALATSRDAYVSSVFDHNMAKAILARSLGLAEEAVAQFLRGR